MFIVGMVIDQFGYIIKLDVDVSSWVDVISTGWRKEGLLKPNDSYISMG